MTIEKQFDNEVAILEAQLDDGTISQEEFESTMREMEQEMRELCDE